MHRQRIAILLLAAAGMAGTFLTWLTLAGAPVSLSGGDRWITFGLFAVAAASALVGDRRRSWRGGGFVAGAIPAVLASAVGIYHIADLSMKTSAAAGQPNLFAVASPGGGLYLVAAAGIVLVAVAFALQGPAPRRAVKAAPANV
jgi:hypothetical protein